MINVDRPMVTDLFIPRSDSSGSPLKTGVFSKKDIEYILNNYVTKEEFYAEVARLEALIAGLSGNDDQ